MTDTKSYALGAGTVYIMVGDTLPETDAAIEIDANKIGDTSGGATLSYSFDTYEVENDNFETLDIVKQKEKVVFKSNMLTWNMSQLGMCTANSVVTTANNKITLKIGTKSKTLQHIIVRFVGTLKNGNTIRATLKGVSTGGFELAFAKDKETIVPIEISALSQADGIKATIEVTEPAD